MAPTKNLLVITPPVPPKPQTPKSVTRSGKPKVYAPKVVVDALAEVEQETGKPAYDHAQVEVVAVEVLPVKEEIRCKSCGRFLSQVSDRCTESVHKKPYVPSAHLSARPLLGNEELKALKDKLTPPKPVQARPGKNQIKKNNQEKK